MQHPTSSLRAVDYKGRSLDDILGQSDADMGRKHDYIQAVPNSPVMPFDFLRDINSKPFVLNNLSTRETVHRL